MGRARRITGWLAAAAIGAAAALAAVWLVHRLRSPVRSRPREQARAALFHELAAGGSTQRDVVVVGDSLTERGEWAELLGRPVANRGISGDLIGDVWVRLDDIAALSPRVVFVLIGINDLLTGVPPEVVAVRHTALIAELRRRLPRARIVVEALLPIRDELVAADAALTTAEVRRTDRALQRGAAAAGAEWLDTRTPLADPTGELDRRYTEDGVHLSPAGYRIWAAQLQPYLR